MILNVSAAAGFFMDRMGSCRPSFLLCLVALAGATALLAVGTNIDLWVAGRLLQGVSAGMLWVVCLALLTNTVGTGGIGQAVGVIGIPMSIGPIVGSLLGGYASGGYYAVFELLLAMLEVDVLLRLAMVERMVAQKWLEAEVVHPRTTESSLKSDLPAISKPYTEISPASFMMAESDDKITDREGPSTPFQHRQLPPKLRLLLSFRMLVALTGGLLQSSSNVASDSTLTLIVDSLSGWEQTGQGLIFITILLPSLLQPVFGAMTDRYNHGRRLIAAGGCLLAVPAYVLLRLVTHNTLSHKALLCVVLVIIGLAIAIAMPAIIAEIGATVADAEKTDPHALKGSVIATGWSLVNAAYAAGCLNGPLFAGMIRNATGWQTTTWCLGLLSAVTGLFLLLCLEGWIGKLSPKN